MRAMSAAALKAMFQSDTSAMFPVLIEIDHDSLASPLRLVCNNADLTYGGNVYTAFPFRFDPPDETDDQIANARLTICNVDRSIVDIIRNLPSRATVSAIAAFYFDEGSLVFEPLASWEFSLANVTYNKSTVSGDLIYEDRLGVNVPALHMTPFLFPGVAAAV